MATAGYLRGQLRITFPGGTTSNLGEVSIPVRTREAPIRTSGSPEITVELTANLEEVRRTIQELFREGADHD